MFMLKIKIYKLHNIYNIHVHCVLCIMHICFTIYVLNKKGGNKQYHAVLAHAKRYQEIRLRTHVPSELISIARKNNILKEKLIY
jgi:hypothetical protein